MKNGMRKEHGLKKLIGAGVMGIALFTSSLSVFAYSSKSIVYSDEIADEIYVSDDVMWGNIDTDFPVNEKSGWVFFDEKGELIEGLNDFNPDIEAYSSCKHDYVSCKATKHIKYADNSCKVEYYEAQKCSKCGDLKVGELTDTITYSPCRH